MKLIEKKVNPKKQKLKCKHFTNTRITRRRRRDTQEYVFARMNLRVEWPQVTRKEAEILVGTMDIT
jgi:hypothetical protein